MTPRPFQLLVDAGNRAAEPPTRYFGSLKAAKAAAAELPPKFSQFVWISELKPDGGRQVHVRDGRPV